MASDQGSRVGPPGGRLGQSAPLADAPGLAGRARARIRWAAISLLVQLPQWDRHDHRTSSEDCAQTRRIAPSHKLGGSHKPGGLPAHQYRQSITGAGDHPNIRAGGLGPGISGNPTRQLGAKALATRTIGGDGSGVRKPRTMLGQTQPRPPAHQTQRMGGQSLPVRLMLTRTNGMIAQGSALRALGPVKHTPVRT